MRHRKLTAICDQSAPWPLRRVSAHAVCLGLSCQELLSRVCVVQYLRKLLSLRHQFEIAAPAGTANCHMTLPCHVPPPWALCSALLNSAGALAG